MKANETLLDITVGEALPGCCPDAGPDRAGLRGYGSCAAGRWTYAELLTDAERTARALLARYCPGDRIAVWAPNLREYVLVQYGIALAGMTMVTINPAYRPGELRFALVRAEAVAVFLLPEYRTNPMEQSLAEVRSNLPELRDAWLPTEFDQLLTDVPADLELPNVDPGDPMAPLYTSGTTGNAKGALIHHKGMVNIGRLVAQAWAGSLRGRTRPVDQRRCGTQTGGRHRYTAPDLAHQLSRAALSIA